MENVKHMKLGQRTSALTTVLAYSLCGGATAADEEVLTPTGPVEPIELEYVLNDGDAASAFGTGSEHRPLRSNVSPDAMAERRGKGHGNDIVDEQQAEDEEYSQLTTAVLSYANELIADGLEDELVGVSVYLREQPFDFERVQRARSRGEPLHREAILEERRIQLEPFQKATRNKIDSLGGIYNGGMVLANMVFAEVPAHSLENLSEFPLVVGLELDGEVVPLANGIERRLAMGMNADGLQSHGWDGGDGGLGRWSGAPVHYGIIEPDYGNLNHWSFHNSSSGGDRVVAVDCDSSPCTPGFIEDRVPMHSTWVTSVLLSDLEDNQDPQFASNVTAQRERSGIAPEAQAVLYSASTAAALARAINDAVLTDLDIINMSVGTPVSDPPKREELCANASAGGVRSAVRAAEDAGVLMVAAAGNYADVVSFCSVSNLASYPDTLAVGATDNVQDLNSHATVDLADSSSRGSNFVVLSDHNTTVTVPMLDLVATGTANLVAGVNTTGYHSDAVFGTSFSAPQIAGAAGLFLDWAYDRGGFGGWEHNPYVIRTMLSVMGDGHTEGGDWVETVSNDWGFGYLRFLSMDGFIGTGARHWSVWWVTAGTGDVFEWPVGSSGAESSTVNGWKFAAVWDYNTFNDSPNMTFELIDKCPSSGGEVLIRRATKRALKQRMRLRANEMSTKYHGRCLWVRANVNHANGSVPLYMAEYAYTNSRLFHDM